MSVEKLTWYVARSGGIVAWVLLALSLVLGLLLSSRLLGRRASPAWILSIHRFLGGLSVIFTAVHVVAIMLDDFVDFGFVEVLVPWASTWKPGAVAWGVIAMYLSVAIELTSFAMKRLPRRVWRAVHWTSAPLFIMATVHGYQAGTDAGRSFIIAIILAMTILALLTVVRVIMSRRRPEPSDPRQLVEQANARRTARAAGLRVEPAVASRPDDPAFDPLRLSDERPPEPVGAAPRAAHLQSATVAERINVAEATPEAPRADWGPANADQPVFAQVAAGEGGPPESAPAFGDLDNALMPVPTAPPTRTPASPQTPPSGGFFDQDAVQTAPAPAWRSPEIEPGPLDWATANAEGDPTIRRREGPVPGVWKRSQRDLDDYLETTRN
jgi:DMSO/TMAO reductase YedYZ heme-binding membrane subunit